MLNLVTVLNFCVFLVEICVMSKTFNFIQGIKELEAALLETTIEQSYMGERVPTVYLELESKILRFVGVVSVC